MPSDEEILIERMKEWIDWQGGPAPLCEPPERRQKHAVLTSIWNVDESERPGKSDTETWRDRPPML